MKIIITTSLFPPEIVEPAPYTENIAKLIKDKNKVKIATYSNNPKKIGVEIVNIKKSNTLFIRLLKFTLSLYKISKNTDLIYVQSGIAVSLPSIIVGFLKKIPVVIRFMEDEAYERAKNLRQTNKNIKAFYNKSECSLKINLIMRLQAKVLKRAKAIITPSKYLKKLIIKKYNISEDKIITNYNIPEKKKILPFDVKKDSFSIFSNEKIIRKSGLENLIKSIKNLKENYNNIKLYLAGEGKDEDYFKKLVKEEKLTNNVIFLGRISKAENIYYRKKSIIHFICSSYENTFDSIIKSFLSKTPIIAIKSNQINEILTNKETGILLSNSEKNSILNSIKYIFNDKKIEEKIIKNSEKLLKEKFNTENHVKNLLDTFNRILK